MIRNSDKTPLTTELMLAETRRPLAPEARGATPRSPPQFLAAVREHVKTPAAGNASAQPIGKVTRDHLALARKVSAGDTAKEIALVRELEELASIGRLPPATERDVRAQYARAFPTMAAKDLNTLCAEHPEGFDDGPQAA